MKNVVSLQELATFIRDAAYSDHMHHNIDWRIAIVHPKTNDGCIGFSGGLWHRNVSGGPGYVSINFDYDEINGLTDVYVYNDNTRVIRNEHMSFEKFKQLVIQQFHIKELYRHK